MSKDSRQEQEFKETLKQAVEAFQISKERCPVCGSVMFQNPEDILWCSSSRCGFGVNAQVTLSQVHELNKEPHGRQS